MNLDILNPAQKEAALKAEGPVLVIAGAGTGKTRVLTYRIARLIEELNVLPSNILAITFTNKASKEMKVRINDLIGDEALSKMWIGTFHSVCVRILRRNYDVIGYSRDFVIYDTQDQKAVIRECYKELDIDDKMYPQKKSQYKISNAKNEMLTSELYKKENEHDFAEKEFIKIYDLYQKKLKEANAMDFDDLLLNAIKIFKRDENVLAYYQNKFKYIHVDEYQDTNKAQYLLVRMLGDKFNNVFVVGDGDQSIYKWRGADIRNIREFENDFSDASVIKLEQNYRSTKVILDVANAVIKNNVSRRDKVLWTDNDEGENIGYYMAFDEEEEAKFVVNTIRHLINSSQYKKNEISILYRTNAQSRSFEKKFILENISYKIIGGVKFYDRKEIKDMMAYLRLVVNPDDRVSFNRVINEPKRGLGAQSLEKINDYATKNGLNLIDASFDVSTMDILSGKAQKGIKEFCNIIKSMIELKDENNGTAVFDVLIELSKYIENLEKEKTDESNDRIDNIYGLRKDIEDFYVKNPDSVLRDFVAETSLRSDVDDLENSDEQVTMMTVHSAKGLEYPAVFLVGMEDGLFPSFMSDEEDAIEEERRLCYVGITRAEKKLYLTHSNRRNRFGRWENMKVSTFIKEMPEEKLELLSEKGHYNCEEKTEEFIAAFEKATQKKENPYKLQLLGDNNGKPKKTKKELEREKAIAGVVKVSQETKNTLNKAEYKVGQTVKTRAFGIGTVVSVTGESGSEQLTIAFESKGIKKLQVGFVPITIVN